MPDLPVVHIRLRLADRTPAELEMLIDEKFDDICAAVVQPEPLRRRP